MEVDANVSGVLYFWAIAMVVSKFLIATQRRCLYPFAPAIAVHYGKSVDYVANTIAAMQAVFMIMPLFTPSLARRWSVRHLMVTALVLQACVFLSLGLTQSSRAFALLCVGMGVAKGSFDPFGMIAMKAFVPKQQHPFVLSLIETSWGLSSLVGMPAVGYLMAANWHAPFVTFAALTLLVAILLHVANAGVRPIDDEKGEAHDDGAPDSSTACRDAQDWLAALQTEQGLALFGGCLLATLAFDAMFISFGVWLASVHRLDTVGIATATFAVGGAEVAAELFLIGFATRLGVVSLTVAGHFVAAAAYLLTMLLTGEEAPLYAGLTVIFLAIFAFEITIVASMGLSLHIPSPVGRGGVYESGSFVFQGLGRTVGVLVGPLLWSAGRCDACTAASPSNDDPLPVIPGSFLYAALFGCSCHLLAGCISAWGFGCSLPKEEEKGTQDQSTAADAATGGAQGAGQLRADCAPAV